MPLHYTRKTPQITPSNPSTALVDLDLSAVALCSEGANSRADIILTKRKESVSMPKTFAELLEALQPDQADVLTKHIASIEATKDADIEKLTNQVTTLSDKVAELEKSKAPAAGEDVMKNLSPELQAMFKKQQETIDSLLKAQADELAKSRFEKTKAIPVAEEDLKAVLKTASPAVYAILEKAAAAIESGALQATGKSADPAFVGTSADELYGKLEKSAKSIMDTEAGLTFEQAFAKACAADPETYKKYAERSV